MSAWAVPLLPSLPLPELTEVVAALVVVGSAALGEVVTGDGLSTREVVTGVSVGRRPAAEGEEAGIAMVDTAWIRAEGVPLGKALEEVTVARAADAEEKKFAMDAGRAFDDAIEAAPLALAVTVLSPPLGAEMAFAAGGATLGLGTAPVADALIVH